MQNVIDLVALWRVEHVEFRLLAETLGTDASALRQFGALCRKQLRYDLAGEAFTATLALLPDDAWLWRELASVYQLSARGDEAAASALAALSIAPDHAGTWLQYASLADGLGQTVESEAAYLRALTLNPRLGDAEFGLGLLYLRTGQFGASSTYLKRAIDSLGPDQSTYLCLAQALYLDGRYGESANVFEQAAELAPLEGHGRRIHARARTFAAMLDGNISAALAHYPALAGAESEPVDTLLRDAFSFFSAFGHHPAAVAVGCFRLELDPGNTVQRYLLDAVAGAPHDRSPAAYIEAYFDGFADGFDSKLVDVLKYQVPEQLSGLVSSVRSSFSSILDLGCGTGLAGPHLTQLSSNLKGVDLSEKMLAKAKARKLYASLIKADAVNFFRHAPEPFDLVFAADVLIYFGDLGDLIDAIASKLGVGGLFAASIELAGDGTFTLMSSGRFAQSAAYFEQCMAPHFEIVLQETTTLRLEANRPVAGALYVLRRKATSSPN